MDKKKLAAKILSVVSKIEAVKKSGYNSHHKYQYSTESDFIEAVRQQLIDEKILVLTSVEEVSKDNTITTVRTKHIFIDTESGEQFEVFSAGQGADSQDKGVYKAITGAMKYFVSKSFMIETQDDPENDGANPSYVKNAKTASNKTSFTKSSPVKNSGSMRNRMMTGKPSNVTSITKSTVSEVEDIDEQFEESDEAVEY